MISDPDLTDIPGTAVFTGEQSRKAKILATDGTSFPQAAAIMTGATVEDYTAMMRAGGRSPEGQRSIREGR